MLSKRAQHRTQILKIGHQRLILRLGACKGLYCKRHTIPADDIGRRILADPYTHILPAIIADIPSAFRVAGYQRADKVTLRDHCSGRQKIYIDRHIRVKAAYAAFPAFKFRRHAAHAKVLFINGHLIPSLQSGSAGPRPAGHYAVSIAASS